MGLIGRAGDNETFKTADFRAGVEPEREPHLEVAALRRTRAVTEKPLLRLVRAGGGAGDGEEEEEKRKASSEGWEWHG